MVLAFLWGAWVLWMQYQNLEKPLNVEKP